MKARASGLRHEPPIPCQASPRRLADAERLEQKSLNSPHLTLPEIRDFNALGDRSCLGLNGFRFNRGIGGRGCLRLKTGRYKTGLRRDRGATISIWARFDLLGDPGLSRAAVGGAALVRGAAGLLFPPAAQFCRPVLPSSSAAQFFRPVRLSSSATHFRLALPPASSAQLRPLLDRDLKRAA